MQNQGYYFLFFGSKYWFLLIVYPADFQTNKRMQIKIKTRF